VIGIEIGCVGDVDTAVLDSISDGLARELDAEVIHLADLPVPVEAYSPERDQYRSTMILHLLCEGQTEDRVTLLVTEVDLYVPELNFVFGEADPATRGCIISLSRLGSSPEGGEATGRLLNERALKEAIHEIGHVLGLGHCANSKCVMFFSNSIMDTDRKTHSFCERCRRRLYRTVDSPE
jgi:archaemetzincin